MHRYRDAVIQQAKNNQKTNGDYKRTVVGAFVLFPYHNENLYQKHPFYKSINEINVGAFPFLPGSTELVTQFLKK